MKKLFLYIIGGIIILLAIPLYITSMNSRSEVDVNSKELKNYAPKFFVEVAKITYPENSDIKHISFWGAGRDGGHDLIIFLQKLIFGLFFIDFFILFFWNIFSIYSFTFFG